jgi:hypothetical protein
MNLSGEFNVAGPIGNRGGLLAGRPNPMIDPRFKIKGGEPWNKTPLLPGKETKEFNERPIPYPMQFQLPGAMFPAGNVGGLLAQAAPDMQSMGGFPGGPMGDAGGFQGPSGFGQGPSLEEMRQQQERMRQEAVLNQRNQERQAMVNAPINYERPQPFTLDVDAAGNSLEKVGGSAVIQLDPNQRLRFGGSYMPGYQEQNVAIPSAAKLEAGYNTPSFGINVNWRPQRQGGAVGGFGGQMDYRTRF